ncbi:hypothetical protein [Elizabethkingia anophelis]|uniref:Uncharacterized protein n=1 Tax=Elizabethkingia anophelis TaxID=1117645 RepID=A0A455ZI08_9FLAO|nr:hypothetical protein [Elizabethkingia anophelis]AQW96143.1 hypothetical protein BBD30_01495 [Elizabethkingia anophelis]MDV3774553.1 hypothetical protein [Elizabethkingia anophelis]MDV3917714.1 hypothetical protein [Elizabethkingia anophelis]MDV4095641.1 hypothetical protein [Elizabethkingia anophelis]OPB61477.1 hypothetical protein BAS07_16765 [Elizabethkingia anophelis]
MTLDKLFEVDKDFYTRKWNPLEKDSGKVVFKYPIVSEEFPLYDYDWYLIVALEKADKVSTDRHLLTRELLLNYRNAIREGYNHQLDSALDGRFSYPRNKNTIQGIKSYIERIFKKQDEIRKKMLGES